MALTPSQARVIDPVLSQHARGYGNPDVERIGSILFPRAQINQRGAKIVKFGREHFRLYNTRRAPGAAKKRVRVGYTDDSVSLHRHDLAGEVPFEILDEANQVPNIDLGRRAVNTPMESIAREQEHDQATIAQDTASYAASNRETLAGTDQWDDDASDPGQQVDDAQAVIRSKIGRRGNVLAIGPEVFRRARRHPKIVGHFYSGIANRGPAMVSREQLADYFGVARVAVGEDVYLPADAADDADFSDMWSDVAILAYVPTVTGDGDIDVPSYGYTYYLRGNPMVETPWQDRNHDVWVYPTHDEYQPVLTGMEAGYLFSDVLASV